MSLAELETAAEREFLSVFGLLASLPDDNLGSGAIALLGPQEPGFWAHVTHANEFDDGASDPLDRWSRRVITGIAETLDGVPLFPFGEPVRPFITWAMRSGRAWSSPVGLLVHDTAGLMVSYRGAVYLHGVTVPQDNTLSPCQTCSKPCLTACPVGALTRDGYDLDACHDFLDSDASADCMSTGCAVRRACPISQSYGRTARQSAFHMRRFHPV